MRCRWSFIAQSVAPVLSSAHDRHQYLFWVEKGGSQRERESLRSSSCSACHPATFLPFRGSVQAPSSLSALARVKEFLSDCFVGMGNLLNDHHADHLTSSRTLLIHLFCSAKYRRKVGGQSANLWMLLRFRLGPGPCTLILHPSQVSAVPTSSSTRTKDVLFWIVKPTRVTSLYFKASITFLFAPRIRALMVSNDERTDHTYR